MGKRSEGYTLGGIRYATKKSIENRCRELLKTLGPTPASEFSFLFDLLRMHRQAEQKIGCGVLRFKIVANKEHWNAHGFALDRLDGSPTDWSYRHCLYPPSHKQEVLKALRYVIRPQIEALNALPGEHVDHEFPLTFQALVDMFLREKSLTYDDISVNPTIDNDVVTRLADPTLSEAWFLFHKINAKLRIVSAKQNLSAGRKCF